MNFESGSRPVHLAHRVVLISRSNVECRSCPFPLFHPPFSWNTPPSPIAKGDTSLVVLGVPRGAIILSSIPGIDKANTIRPVCVDRCNGAPPLQHGRACTVNKMAHLKAREELRPSCRPAIHTKAFEWIRRAREEGRVGQVERGEIERRNGRFATPWKEHLAEPSTVRALAVGAGLDDRVEVAPAGERAEGAGEVAH